MDNQITNTADLLDALKALPRRSVVTLDSGVDALPLPYIRAKDLDAVLERYKPLKSVPKRPKRGPSRGKDYWRTPPELVAMLPDLMSGPIQLDPCASPDPKHHFAEENLTETGLVVPWGGRTFINPPYSAIKPWVVKGSQAWEDCGRDTSVFSALYLIPPSVDSSYWCEHLLPTATFYATRKGRIQFWGDDGPIRGNTKGSALIGWVADPQAAAAVLVKAGGWSVERPRS